MEPAPHPRRTVICADAELWLSTTPRIAGASFVTSLPDISETRLDLRKWKQSFVQRAEKVLHHVDDQGVAIFYQSDILIDGIWIDKAFLCQQAAENCGHELLFHRIACREAPGTPTAGRASYSHILCFSKQLRRSTKAVGIDVLPEDGSKTWTRGMGAQSCLEIARFLKDWVQPQVVVDPFCGEGAVLAAVNAFEMNAIGVERSPKRAESARTLELLQNPLSFVEGRG